MRSTTHHLPRSAGMIAALAWVALAVPVAGAQTIAITGGKVYPVSSPAIDGATVLIRDGTIVAVGRDVAIPEGAQRIDATGKVVTPGLVDASTQLGLVEIGQERPTRDVSAKGRDQIAASFRVWDGLNSESVLIPPARNEGVTSVVVAPSGGLVSGQAAVIDLADAPAREMLRRGPVAMVAQIDQASDAGTESHGETIGKLRELLDDTRFYMRHRDAYDRAASRRLIASRADLEAMIPVIEGKLPLAINADRLDDIDAVIAIGRDYHITPVIVGGAEAWLAAPRLAAARIPVVTGAMNNIPSSYQTLNQRQSNAAILARAGVRVAIIGNSGGGDEELYNVRNVKYEAGNAVSYGMSHDDALRAVTLTPAELFGVADRIGALQPGTVANVVVWSGDPFELSTRAEHVFIRGRESMAPSRQDLLARRYRKLPPDFEARP